MEEDVKDQHVHKKKERQMITRLFHMECMEWGVDSMEWGWTPWNGGWTPYFFKMDSMR